MGEGDHPAKEEALRRLSEPEDDHEVHHPHLWEALHRVHFSHEADSSRLEDWRRAPEGSQEEIWAEHYDEAMGILATRLH
jgi:hypothetical protein